MQRRLRSLVAQVIAAAAGLKMRICGAGAHPFCHRFALITHLPRFRELKAQFGYLACNQMTYATHVHVAMASGDQAMRVMRLLAPSLPVLLAAAANSPFWRGLETHYASFRQRVLAASRSYGLPQLFDDWATFERFLADARDMDVFRSVRDIHWDLRPHPDFGTLELRVMDAQSSIASAAELAALVQALMVYLARTPDDQLDPRLPRQLPGWLERHNYFEASRLGLAAPLVEGRGRKPRRMGDVALDLVDIVLPVARSLNAESFLLGFAGRLGATVGYRHQLDLFRRTGSLLATVAALAGELEEETSR